MPSIERLMRQRHVLLSAFCLAASSPAAAQDLAAAISGALESPTLAEASAGEAAANARLDRARAERNPLLRIEGSAGAGRIDNGGFFGITADNVNPVGLQAVAEMPLFTGGKISSAVSQAQGGADVAKLQREQVRLQTTVRAVAAYSEVLTSRKLEARYQGLVDQLAEIDRQAALRFRVGDIANTERAQARARRAEADAGFAQAQGRRVSAESAFQHLTGLEPGTLAPMPSAPKTPATLGDALSGARAHNPALRQAKSGVDIARAGIRSAKAEGLPTLGVFAEAAHVRDQFFPGYRADSVSVGVRGKWTLFAGGRVGAQSRVASAELSASAARLKDAGQIVDDAVIDAWQGLATARRVAEASRLRNAAAEEALRGTRLEAKVGAKPTLAVLDAEREAIEAEAAQLQAEGMEIVAAWRLNALTGNLDR